MDFPYKEISEKQAFADYEKLRKISGYTYSNVGNIATDFFTHRFRIKAKVHRWSHYDAWNTPEQREIIYKVAMKLKKLPRDLITDNHLRSAMEMNYNSVNQFKANIAKHLYKEYNATKVLDFCAGWGGRLLGAMSLDIDYTGIDTNNLPYPEIIDKYHTLGNCKVIISKAEDIDYSKIDYDFVFTSPPYENLEVYENMPIYKDFYKEFYEPVLKNTWKHLPMNCYYVLNIPEKMVEKTERILGKVNHTIPLIKASRCGSGGVYKEKIYIWKKETPKGTPEGVF
jgi:16S rRNA G966 N2-methylase RsmD